MWSAAPKTKSLLIILPASAASTTRHRDIIEMKLWSILLIESYESELVVCAKTGTAKRQENNKITDTYFRRVLRLRVWIAIA